MPDPFERTLDTNLGFNFNPLTHTPVGYLTTVKVSGTDLKPDFKPKDPENPRRLLGNGVVAVLSHILWRGGVTDPFSFSGSISAGNGSMLKQRLFGSMDIAVELNPVIYQYDPGAQKYFKSLSVGTALKGLIEKNGNKLNVWYLNVLSSNVPSPMTFRFQVGITPQRIVQSVRIAKTAAGPSISRPWGRL